MSALAPFCLLAEPDNYQACPWDLVPDADIRAYWRDFFRRQFEVLLNIAVDSEVAADGGGCDAPARAQAARQDFYGFWEQLEKHPRKFGRVDLLMVDARRDQALRHHGFVDPYLPLKNRENRAALPLLPEVCRQLDALSGRELLTEILRGVFAGNIFDMGVEATAKRILEQKISFLHTRDSIPPRPWLVDGFDAAAQRILHGPAHRKAIVFIDNAGGDFVLGLTPLARYLAQRGTRVVLAANELPTLNDMTIGDLRNWWGRILEAEPSLGNLPIEMVSTGTAEPLIDLLKVGPELNAAAADADLVILEGMGRAVESNLRARFRCDALKLAMIKDLKTAQWLGGKLFDVVCGWG